MGLSGVGLEVEEAPALAEQLGKFPALKQLNVSRNPRLGDDGAKSIAAAVEGNSSLQRLQLVR